MKLVSKYNLPKIECKSVEQGAFAFALRECFLNLESEIDDCMIALSELVNEPDISWNKILKKTVYVLYFENKAGRIIEVLNSKYNHSIIDLRVLGYATKSKNYDEYVNDFAESNLYDLEENMEDGEESI